MKQSGKIFFDDALHINRSLHTTEDQNEIYIGNIYGNSLRFCPYRPLYGPERLPERGLRRPERMMEDGPEI